MHVLLVNDDGIHTPGIRILLKIAAQRGHTVTMFAPAIQQSAVSHSITLDGSVFVRSSDSGFPNAKAYIVFGTPADCVRVALMSGLMPELPDVVISGINNGTNAGMDVHYSGTVAAAMEASMKGLRAIATSIGRKASSKALHAMANLTLDMAERYCRIPPQPLCVMNLNAPALPPEEWLPMVYAPLNISRHQEGYEMRGAVAGHRSYVLTGSGDPVELHENTDQWYLDKGHVTVTMLGNFAAMTAQDWNALNI